MGKKKDKKKKNQNTILMIDTGNLSDSYSNILMDIKSNQYELDKLIKKEMKRHKKEYGYACSYEQARKRVLKSVEGGNVLDRTLSTLSAAGPQMITIAQLVGIGIETFMSIPAVQYRIKPTTVKKLTKAFDACSAYGVKKKKKK